MFFPVFEHILRFGIRTMSPVLQLEEMKYVYFMLVSTKSPAGQ